MPKQINLKDILKKNQHISKEDLARSQALLDELRQAGNQLRGYRLASPLKQRRVIAGKEQECDDPRTINLASSRP